MNKISLSLIFVLVLTELSSLNAVGQWRRASLGNDDDNSIHKISFYSASEGYVAFRKYIGFTQDSGKTFIRRYITNSNVDYNGRPVNLTAGFYPSGVKAFNGNVVLAYGDYLTEPSILYSNNGGNSWSLVFHQTVRLNASEYNEGITDLEFPGNSLIGFAVHHDQILKTTNGGLSWNVSLGLIEEKFEELNMISASVGYAKSRSRVFKTVNGGLNWNPITLPSGQAPRNIFFLDDQRGFIDAVSASGSRLFYSNNSGNTWVAVNDGSISPYFPRKMYFIDDSTGYGIGGYEVWKTLNGGKIWEPMPRTDPFNYLNYRFEDLFFFNSQLGWAGGGHEYLEFTSNGGGLTIPKSYFQIDTSELHLMKINLTNYSRQGYTYKWYKNDSLVAQTYNAFYFTNRLTIDTIKLVVSNGVHTDSSFELIDTRLDKHVCFAAFSYSVDTSSVRFSASDSFPGLAHYWDFGDGTFDSINVKPVHKYDSAKTYLVKHVIFNPVDRCRDSLVQQVTITRVTNCILINFTYQNDPFFVNQYSFTGTTEPVLIGWQQWTWGDGSPAGGGFTPTHTFDSAKDYSVCYSVKPYYTSCTTMVCKTISVNLVDGCNPGLRFTNLGEPTAFRFNSYPLSSPSKKIHTWIFDDKDTIHTGSTAYFEKQYSNKGTEYSWLNYPWPTYRYSFNPDSQFRKIRHIVYDSLSGCENFYDTVFRLSSPMPRLSITFQRHPLVPNYVTFFALDTINGVPYPFYPRIWRVESWIGGWGGQQYGPNSNSVNYAVSYRFNSPGIYRAAFMSRLPNENGNKQDIYETFITIDSITPCPEIPDFTFYSSPTNKLYYTFTSGGEYFGGGTGNMQWFFGDGDSTAVYIGYNGETRYHSYKSIGNYLVKMRFSSTPGCWKEVQKEVLVRNTVDTALGPGNSMNLSTSLVGQTYQWQLDTGGDYVNIGDDGIYTGTNSQTLNIKLPPTSFYGYKYRCLVSSGGQQLYNTEYVLRFETYWWGNISTDWNNGLNWSSGRVPDQNTDIIIEPGATFFPEVGSNIIVKSLTIKSGANVTLKTGYTITLKK